MQLPTQVAVTAQLHVDPLVEAEADQVDRL
jgi:hypothetical protein